MLRAIASSIAPSLTTLFNLSIKTGKIPNSWKLSSVVPIPKTKPASNNSSNYRPISLLSIVSKLLEKHICGFLLSHFQQKGLLAPSHWGFSPGKSTTSALLATFHCLLQLSEAGHDLGLVFFDLKKGVRHSSS